jgi:hypothetical protein
VVPGTVIGDTPTEEIATLDVVAAVAADGSVTYTEA